MNDEPIEIYLRETDPLEGSKPSLERWVAEAERLLSRMRSRDDAETAALRSSLERELQRKRGLLGPS